MIIASFLRHHMRLGSAAPFPPMWGSGGGVKKWPNWRAFFAPSETSVARTFRSFDMKVGDRVTVKATIFDAADDEPEDRWSRIHFPNTWRTHQLHGEIIAVGGRQRWTCRWDYDGSESTHHTRQLRLVTDHEAATSGEDESESDSDAHGGSGGDNHSESDADMHDDPIIPNLRRRRLRHRKCSGHKVQESLLMLVCKQNMTSPCQILPSTRQLLPNWMCLRTCGRFISAYSRPGATRQQLCLAKRNGTW